MKSAQDPLKFVAFQYLMDACDDRVSSEERQRAMTILNNQIDGKIINEIAFRQMDSAIGFHGPAQKIAAILGTGDTPIFSSMEAPQRYLQMDHRKCRNWTQYEDQRLLNAVHKYGLNNWNLVSDFVGNNRTKSQCSQRWDRGLNPRLYKGPWSKEQEEKLINLVEQFGERSWKKIAAMFGNRSDVQCRYHYQKMMKPKENANSFSSSEEEKEIYVKTSEVPLKEQFQYIPPVQTPTAKNANLSIIQQLIYQEHFSSVFDSDDNDQTAEHNFNY